jgi:hypothetical protein
MAKPSDRDIRYRELARGLDWDGPAALWLRVKDGTTDPEWDQGKAFEYFVIRAFELSGLRVEYPYDVPPGGNPIEQIDGMVLLGPIPFLIECKDRESVDVDPIAKLHHQLSRRPPLTMACVFTTGKYTAQALTHSDLCNPQQITLWSKRDIDLALGDRDFEKMLVKKFRDLYMFGLTDHSSNYRDLEVEDE